MNTNANDTNDNNVINPVVIINPIEKKEEAMESNEQNVIVHNVIDTKEKKEDSMTSDKSNAIIVFNQFRGKTMIQAQDGEFEVSFKLIEGKRFKSLEREMRYGIPVYGFLQLRVVTHLEELMASGSIEDEVDISEFDIITVKGEAVSLFTATLTFEGNTYEVTYFHNEDGSISPKAESVSRDWKTGKALKDSNGKTKTYECSPVRFLSGPMKSTVVSGLMHEFQTKKVVVQKRKAKKTSDTDNAGVQGTATAFSG